MKVLVTGGCGFIGSHITDFLINAGHEVAIADNLSTGNLNNLNKKAKLYQVDILSPEFENVFKDFGPEIVYHEAAQIDIQKSIKDTFFDAKTNVLGTICVLEMVAKYNVKKIIYASSAAVYGNPQYLPVDEKHVVAPMSFYGISKHTPEHYIKTYSDIHGFKYTVLRYANVYGPRQDPKGEGGVVSIFTNKFIAGESPTIFGDGKQTRDFVYVKDIAGANLAAIDKGDNEIINVSTNIPTTVNDISDSMKRAGNFDIEVLYGPARVGDIDHSYLDNTKGIELLGFKFKYSLDEGLKETVDYYKELAAKQ